MVEKYWRLKKGYKITKIALNKGSFVQVGAWLWYRYWNECIEWYLFHRNTRGGRYYLILGV